MTSILGVILPPGRFGSGCSRGMTWTDTLAQETGGNTPLYAYIILGEGGTTLARCNLRQTWETRTPPPYDSCSTADLVWSSSLFAESAQGKGQDVLLVIA
eukprot:5952735-Amphidinium_carterae.1